MAEDFPVNTVLREWNQTASDVAMAQDGRFVVVYEGQNVDGSDRDVIVQCYEPDGYPVGMPGVVVPGHTAILSQ